MQCREPNNEWEQIQIEEQVKTLNRKYNDYLDKVKTYHKTAFKV